MRRAALALATVVLLGPGLGATAPGVAALAAPATCAGTGVTAHSDPTVPWPQRWFGLDRLAGIADGAGVTVAVLDSGVDGRHPQLRGRVATGADPLRGTGRGDQDCVGHGTAVASIIAAAPVPGVGLRGIAPAARILPVRVTESVTGLSPAAGTTGGRLPGSAAGLAAAIRFAVSAGARVANVSMVLTRDDPAVRAAVSYALDHDVLVVAAAGNGHRSGPAPDPVSYPAGYPGVLAVASVGPDRIRAADSQLGGYLTVAAPGIEVTAAVAGTTGQARDFTGTSFAAPFVSGTAALIRQHWPALSVADVVHRIAATADPAADPAPGPPSAGYGYGLLNPYRAVTATVTGSEASGPDGVVPATSPTGGTTPARHAAPGNGASGTGASGAGALGLAGLGVSAAVLVALAGTALPRAARRRWRPGDR